MSTKRLRGIGPEPSGPASVSPVAGSGYDTVVLSDPPRSSRNSSKRRASTDVNALIGDAMESMRQKGDEKIREQSVPGTAAAPSPEEKGTTISTGTSATTPSGRGGTRRARKSLREVASDKACEKISGFTHRGGWTGEFLDPEAERKYMEYAAFSNQNSLQQFATTMGIVTTIMLVVRLVVSDTDKIDDNSMVVGWILQVLSLILLSYMSFKPEKLLLKTLWFPVMFFIQSTLSIGCQCALHQDFGPTCLVLFIVYHNSACLLFSSLRSCAILAAIQTPIMAACAVFLNGLNKGVGTITAYCTIIILFDVVMLFNVLSLEEKQRTAYATVVFIAEENNMSQIALHREGLFGDSDVDDDSGGERGDSRRTKLHSHFSRDVFIHSWDVEILEEVGRGSFGIVYKGTWHDTVICVKHLTGAANLQDENEFFKGFAKEAQLMSNLRHPNIVMFMGVIVESDFVGLVTEFCFEGNISDVLLDESKDFDDSIFMSMIIDICRGMSFLHLHEPSIIHKDLKGQNILVNDNWQCKVADFGLSKLQTSEEMRTKPDDAAMSPQKIGAVMWAAPEVLTNENECNKASDVYSFGVVLFEVLYRELPYATLDAASIAFKVSQGKRPDEFASSKATGRLLQLSPKLVPLVKIMKRCWAEDPNHRPNFHDILERLEDESVSVSSAIEEEKSKIKKNEINSPNKTQIRAMGGTFRVKRKSSRGGIRRGSISSAVDRGKFHLSADNLKIGKRLGTGTFGQVFAGTYFGTNVAVKELFANKLTDDLIVEFHQECNLFKDMRHPNIVLFMGSAFDVGKLYMVMELCENGSIMNLYTNIKKPFRPEVHMGKCLDLANDMAQGGAYLHMHDPPIIHRDLKSENVLVDGNFVAKITDFGQSRFNDDAKAMTACGSPLWTAPEVIRGEKYSEKADIFSFSIILWELLSWSTPYKGENPHFVMMKVASQGHRLDIDESWDPFFKDLVAKCWHATPTSRPSFADITEMIMTCDKETELVKYKGDWRDTTKTFRKKKAMNRANSMRRGLGGASPSSPTRAVEVGFKEDALWDKAPARRSSVVGGTDHEAAAAAAMASAANGDGASSSSVGSSKKKTRNVMESLSVKDRIMKMREMEAREKGGEATGASSKDIKGLKGKGGAGGGERGKRRESIAIQAAKVSQLLHMGGFREQGWAEGGGGGGGGGGAEEKV